MSKRKWTSEEVKKLRLRNKKSFTITLRMQIYL
ncbi:hypothetical protein SAMN05421659_1356 [[Clostridium] fimetarium]|uniref:Uncharacterized protein n=1 Tax=[Clostridium] fimetarium TaxID=99656 RepID=A0A1I0RYH1_9FIRM|nr:hypothetical protein SAMN05421659_1356 [[Clostridium] fimetarium]